MKKREILLSVNMPTHSADVLTRSMQTVSTPTSTW